MKFFSSLLIIIIFSLDIYSQETDSTLLRLEKNIENATTPEEKIQALLSAGEYQVNREFTKVESYLVEAEKLIEDCGEHKNEHLAAILAQRGIVERRKGNYSQAISYYLQAKKLFEELGDVDNLADVIHNIGLVYRYQEENEKAIQNFQTAVRLNRQVKDTFGVAAAYNMMGVSYRKINLIDSALVSYKKAKDLFIQLKREEDIRGVDNNMATVYYSQGDYKKALSIKKDNLLYYKKVGNKVSTCSAYFSISQNYSKLKNYNFALQYADSCLTVALQEGFKERASKAYLRKSVVYRDIKNYKAAYENYKLYKKYSDSIFNVETVKKIQELELNYEFEKQKKELELLSNEKESEVKLYVFLFILALIVGLTVGYLVYRNYTARARIVREKLEKEKLKKELLKEKVKVSESELKSLVADNSMRLQFIKELSENIKEDKKASDSKDIQQYTQSLILRLQQQIATESKLSSIQDRIEEVNRGFDKKVMKLYPSLTKTEREVCALLRLNLSIKEIAAIRNATIDSVKASRYRIRKKLEVPSGIELEHFVQSL